MTHNYIKLTSSLRAWFLGREFYTACTMLELCIEKHKAMRGDKITPYYTHPIAVCQFVRTLDKNLIHPEQTYCVALGHDLIEDTGVTFEYLWDTFGHSIANEIKLLSKDFNSKNNDYRSKLLKYYSDIATNPVSSIVKAADRIHNFSTMNGAFSSTKQLEYVGECNSFILPSLKIARRNFPSQEPAYENLKWMLRSQIDLIEQIHKSTEN